MATTGLRVTVMNSFRVEFGGDRLRLSGTPAVKTVAYLALNSGQAVTHEQLVDVLWDRDPPRTADRQVRNTVSMVRRILREAGFDRMMNRNKTSTLHDAVTDVLEFNRVVAEARRLGRDGETERALDRYEAARAMVPADPFPDLDTEVFTREATRVARELELADIERVELLVELGCWGDTARAARLLLDSIPHSDRLVRALMTAHHRLGEPGEASRVFDAFRRRLADETGLDPAPRTRDLHVSILRDREAGVDAAALKAAPAELPAAPVPFVGRHSEAATLADTLTAASGGPRVALVDGPGGMGKSALAMHVAHRVAPHFPDGQVYIDLTGHTPGHEPMPPERALRRLLRSVGHAAAENADADELAARLRTATGGRRFLFVLDNAHDTAQVRRLLPGSDQTAVIVTSRRPLALTASADAVHMAPMSEAESAELIRSGLGAGRAADEAAVATVVRACAGMPLALVIAVARCRAHPDLPLPTLAARLEADHSRLSQLSIDDLAVRSSVMAGYKDLEARGGEHAEAARVLAALGLHAGTDFEAGLVAVLAQCGPVRAERILNTLLESQLVTDLAGGRYGLHDLVKLFAVETARSAFSGQEAVAVTQGVFDYYFAETQRLADRVVPRSMPPLARPRSSYCGPERTLDEWRRWAAAEAEGIIRTAFAVRKRTSADDELVVEYCRTGYRVLTWAHVEPASLSGLMRLGLRTAEGLPASRQVFSLVSSAVIAHTESRDFERAEELIAWARRIAADLDDRLFAADCDLRLAAIRLRTGELEEAWSLVRRALAVADAAGHARLQGLGSVLASRAAERLGRSELAVEYARTAADRARLIGDDDADNALVNLAFRCTRAGRPDEAWPIFAMRLTELRRRGSGDSVEAAKVIWGLGETYAALGDADSPRNYWRRSAEILADHGLMPVEESARFSTRPGPPPPEHLVDSV